MIAQQHTAPEFTPYVTPSKTLVGCSGKHGFLRLGFELDAQGRSILRDWERRAPLIVQQALYFDEEMTEMPCVYILSSGGPNIEGDRYEQHITLKQGAFAHISTGAATKLAEMRHNYASLEQLIELDEAAYLEYLPEAMIPCRHSRYRSETTLRVAPTATLFYSEIWLSGRKYYKGGEQFQYDILSITTHGERPNREPLFHEKFIIRPKEHSPESIGQMNGYDVLGNILVLTPPPDADRIYEKIEPFIDIQQHIALGITRLPRQAGLNLKILGQDTQSVKRLIRKICSVVRLQIKGHVLFDEFPWR